MNTHKLAEILNRIYLQAYRLDAHEAIEQVAIAVAAECQQTDPSFCTGEFLVMCARDPETEKFNAGKYSLLPPSRSPRA